MKKLLVALGAMGTLAGLCRAGVLDDCTMLFVGGDDKNGNGCFDDGEFRERLHPGDSTVTRAWDFPADCITWTNMDVSCNCKSNVLKNQTCLYFHQKGTVDGKLTDKACALALPKFGFSESVVSNYQPYTVLFRVKLPAADTKADGTTYTGAGISKSEVATDTYYGTIAAVGNDRTSGHYRGTDFRVSHSPSIPTLGVVAQNWNSGAPWTVWDCTFTNASCKTRTRDAEWVEVAVRGYVWTWEKKPAPGVKIDAWWWNGSASHGANGGRNGAPLGTADFLLGNHPSGSAKSGFQGAIHFVAAWKRDLTDDECKEAFKIMAGSTDSFHDGNSSGLYRFGYDAHDGSRFGGATGGATTLTTPCRFPTEFPSNFTAGTHLTLKTPLDKFTQNMKQVLRLKAATGSATGRLCVKANGTTLAAGEFIQPGKTYLYYLTPNYFTGDELDVELDCLDAGAGGIVLATVEVCGSWTIGLKDKSTTNIVPGSPGTGSSYRRTFTVGSNLMTDFPVYWYDYQINTVRSYTDIKFYVPEGLSENFRYVFKGSVYGGGMDATNGAPHEYILNGGTKRSDRFFFINTTTMKDYEMTINPNEFTNGWNTIRCQNYVTNTMNGTSVKTWRYTYWDYVTLQIVKCTNRGTILIVR